MIYIKALFSLFWEAVCSICSWIKEYFLDDFFDNPGKPIVTSYVVWLLLYYTILVNTQLFIGWTDNDNALRYFFIPVLAGLMGAVLIGILLISLVKIFEIFFGKFKEHLRRQRVIEANKPKTIPLEIAPAYKSNWKRMADVIKRRPPEKPNPRLNSVE